MKRPGLLGIGLVVLLVADLVLVLSAIGIGPLAPGSPDTSSPATSSRTSPAAGASPSGSPSDPSSAPSAAPSAGAAGVRRILAPVDGQRAWRASVGSCSQPGRVEVTTDGGRRWEEADDPGGAVLRLRAGEGGFVVTTTQGCAASLRGASADGRSWSPGQSATGAWALAPGETSAVLAPGVDGAVEACAAGTVRSLAATGDDSALVLCSTGLVRQTPDTGRTWTDRGDVAGATSLAASTERVLIGTRDAAGCDGYGTVSATLSGDGELDLGEPACVPDAGGAAADAVVGLTGDGAGWLSVGDDTWHSEDLTAWSKS